MGTRRWSVILAALVLSAIVFAGEEAKETAVPDGVRGFQGMVAGTIVKKGEREFILKVEKLLRVWKGNKAAKPEEIVGHEIRVTLKEKQEHLLKALAELKEGDRIECEPFHLAGNSFVAVETLRKAEERPKE